ncbi:MAG: arginine--tRNA ligase [Pseudomonadota bacterium]
MNIFSYYEAKIQKAVQQLITQDVLSKDIRLQNVSVEPPRDPDHGDVATNIAMVLSKQAKMNPRDLAAKIADIIHQDKFIEKIDIAGPGFINLVLKNEIWYEVAEAIHKLGKTYGRSNIGNEEVVNVEYVSANPTGPMHVGHCRGAVFGDALANLLEFAGFKVTREYYINDAGAQVDVLARSAYLRYREALGENIGDIPEGLYPGDYLIPVGKQIAEDYGASLLNKEEEEWLPIVRTIAIDANMELIKQDLAALNITHDVFFSERSLLSGETDQVAETIEWLQDEKLVYHGRLSPPKGKMPEDWEDREQLLFKSKNFGDDVDRALMKADGSYTYFAADIAYHKNKYDRGFKKMINVWGADHGGYIKRMQSAINALTANQGKLDVKICQLVNLLRAGQPIKMSKRAGTYVTLREVVDEVGSDVTRFIMLYRKNDAVLDFDFDAVLEQSRENPVFYVQYAHARIYSVFRNAADVFEDLDIESLKAVNIKFQCLDSKEEINLIKKLAEFPRTIEAAALNHEVHRIAFYIYELASEFHSLWNRGKELPQLRFINSKDRLLTEARLALILNVATIIASGLEILGVKPKLTME